MQAPATTEQTLEYQADMIELVLNNHNAASSVMGGTVTPRWVSFHVMPSPTTKVAKVVGLSEEIALRLGTDQVRISRQGAAVKIDVPRADAQAVHLLQLCRQLNEIPRQSAILGLDEEGLPLLLRLSSPEVAHVLIAGTTGSGKTALARSIALSLAIHNRLGEVQMLFIDPKGNGFGPFASDEGRLPHMLRPIVQDIHQAIFLLGEIVGEMTRRDREKICEPRLIIFIDELADLMEQGGKALDRLMTRLTQRGRSAGIHIVACTQKPLAAAIGSLTRSNFPVRLVGSVASSDDAKVAAGIPNTKAEKLLGRGDFLLVTKGQTTRFQSAYVADWEIEQIIERLSHGARTSRQWGGDVQEHNEELAATGTDGRLDWLAPEGSRRRRGLELMFGHQLRLIK